jgi:hypothetical protein
MFLSSRSAQIAIFAFVEVPVDASPLPCEIEQGSGIMLSLTLGTLLAGGEF